MGDDSAEQELYRLAAALRALQPHRGTKADPAAEPERREGP